jgi:hypothetical protein
MARSPVLWCAEEGSVTIGGLKYTTQVTDIAITAPKRDAEIVNMFGNTQGLITKAADLAECTLTAVAQGGKFAEMLLGGSDATAPFLTSGIGTRYYQPIVYTWTDPTDTNGAALRITMTSGLAVSEEFSQSVDGHLEETVNFKCTPTNFKVEWTSWATGSALP